VPCLTIRKAELSQPLMKAPMRQQQPAAWSIRRSPARALRP